jgi:hypothetical protein
MGKKNVNKFVNIYNVYIFINRKIKLIVICLLGECYAAYKGVYCEQEHDPCTVDKTLCSSNISMAIECRRNASDIERGYSCLCPLGYESRLAAATADGSLRSAFKCDNVNECETTTTTTTTMMRGNLCENNSTCVDTVGSYKCVCLRGFSGDRCQMRIKSVEERSRHNYVEWNEWSSWSMCTKSRKTCNENFSQQFQYSNRTCALVKKNAHQTDPTKRLCAGVYERKRKCPEIITRCSTRQDVYFDYLIFYDQVN